MIIQNQNIDLTEINSTLGSTSDGGGSSTQGSLMAKSNAILDKLNDSSSNSVINTGGAQEFTSNGTFTVPAGVTKIWVTACAGGASGSAVAGNFRACGGNGGEAILHKPFSVTPGQQISITIGAGGASVQVTNLNCATISGTAVGNPGGATAIGNLITLLGGTVDTYESPGVIVRTGGGIGGQPGYTVIEGPNWASVGDGIYGMGYTVPTLEAGGGLCGSGGKTYHGIAGGGGGSLGAGGYGGVNVAGGPGVLGGGGGGTWGVAGGSALFTSPLSGAGGSGYCLIEW